MANAIDINDENFEQEVLNSDVPVMVDFWATWCAPCRKLSPLLDDIANELGDKIKFVKINTDDNMKVAHDYSISGLPTVLIFKDGKAEERMVGMVQKSTILSNIEKYL